MPAAVRLIGALALVVLLAGGESAGCGEPEADPALAAVLGDPRFAPHVLKAIEARTAGDVDGALDHLRQANNAIKRAKGANHPDQLPVLDLAAEILFDAGRYDDAVTPLKRAVAIREGLIKAGQAGNHDVAMASSLLLMGRAHASKGRFDTGLEALTRAVRVLDETLGRGHEATQRARRELAEAVSIFERTLGLDHPATIKAQRERVAVEVSVGDYAAAARVLDGMLDAERARGGEASAGALALTGELARIVQHAGRPEDAASLVETVVERAEGSAVDRSAVAKCLRELAEIRLADDAPEAAQQAATKALGIDSSGGDETAPAAVLDRLLLLIAGDEPGGQGGHDLAALSGELLEYASQRRAEAACGLRLAARAALAAGEAESAADFVRRAAELDESILGAAHPDTFADRLLLARSELADGAGKEALELLEASHRDARAALGASHATALEIAETIAQCQTELGRVEDAEKVLLAVVSREVPYAGRAIEARLVGIFDRVAEALEARKESSRATALRDELVSLRRRQFGGDDPRVAETLAAFGRLGLSAKRWDDVIRFSEASLAIRERAGEGDHPEAASTLLALGRALRGVKRHEDARAAFVRASSIWNLAVGPRHPVACETMKLLALTELSLGRPNAALPLMERLLAAYDANPETDPEDVARLLVKLAEVRTARGDVDIARGHLARALALRSASDSVVTAVDVADFATRNRLADDDDPVTINDVRELADGAGRPAAGGGGVAEVIRLAWEYHSAGQREAARELLRSQVSREENSGKGDGPPLADLLVALADMREVPLDTRQAIEWYRRAAAIRGVSLGDPHPATVAAALRLAGAGIAAGNLPLAGSTLSFAAERAAHSADLAGPAAVAWEVAVQTALIAVAADQPALAIDAIRAQARLCEGGDAEAQVGVLECLSWRPLVSAQRASVESLREPVVVALEKMKFPDQRCSRAATLGRVAAAASRGDHAAAGALLEGLVAAEDRSPGGGDLRLAADLLRLADARARLGRGAADEPRNRAWQMIDALQRGGGLPVDRPGEVEAILDVAGVLVDAGDAERAERLLKSAVDMSNAPGAGRPVAVGRLMLALGELRLGDRPQQAARSFAEAMRIVRDAVGGGHGLAVAAAIRVDAAARRAAELEEAALSGRRHGTASLAAGRNGAAAAELPAELAAGATPAGATLEAASQRAKRPLEPAAVPVASPRPPAAEEERQPALPAPVPQERHESQLAAIVSREALAGQERSDTVARRVPADRAAAALRDVGQTLPPLERAEALKLAADEAIAGGDVAACLDTLRQLGSLQWRLHGGDDRRVVGTMLRYAELLRQSGDLGRAAALVDRAREHAAAGSTERALAMVCQARLLREGGQAAAAAEMVAEAARELGVDGDAPAVADRAGGGEPALRATVAVARAAIDMGLPALAAAACDAVRRSTRDGGPAAGVAEENRFVLVESHLARGEAGEAETDARWLLEAAQGRDKPDAALVAMRRVLLARALVAGRRAEWRKQAAAAAGTLAPLLAQATPQSCPPQLVEAARHLAEAGVAAGEPAVVLPILDGLRHAAFSCLPAGHEETAPAIKAAAKLAGASGRDDVGDALEEAAESAAAIRRSGDTSAGRAERGARAESPAPTERSR